MSKQVFFGDWDCMEDVLREFAIDKEALKDCKIIAAEYTRDGYEGSAYVLFKRDGKLWEVSGGHCSCNGLEDQWEPEETTKEALKHRWTNGTCFNRREDGSLAQTIRDFVTVKPRKKKTDQQ